MQWPGNCLQMVPARSGSSSILSFVHCIPQRQFMSSQVLFSTGVFVRVSVADPSLSSSLLPGGVALWGRADLEPVEASGLPAPSGCWFTPWPPAFKLVFLKGVALVRCFAHLILSSICQDNVLISCHSFRVMQESPLENFWTRGPVGSKQGPGGSVLLGPCTGDTRAPPSCTG